MTFFIVGVEGLDISYKLEKLDTEAERSKAGGGSAARAPQWGQRVAITPDLGTLW